MPYDFPSSPVNGQEYTPPVGGQTYIYQSPRWLVKGIPPAGGGGGGGIPEAPVDGQQYGREDAAWTVVEPPASDWADITGKPSTFPPTVPIAWTDVSGKPATFPPTLPIAQSDVTGLVAGQSAQDTAIGTKLNTSAYTASDVLTKIKTVDGSGSGLDADLLDGQDGAYYSSYANLTGKPATFPPTLPIAQSDVTNLVTDLGAKAPLASPAFSGTPTVPNQTAGNSSMLIANTSFVTNAIATREPTITGGTTAQYWRGDKSWQTLPAPGIADAPNDGMSYVRTNAGWEQGTLRTTDGFTIVADADATSKGFFFMVDGRLTLTTGVVPTGTYDVATKGYVDGKGGMTISDTAPSSPVTGQLWFESDTGNTYIWYADADSSQWVQVNVLGAAQAAPYVTKTAESYNRAVNGNMQISQEYGDTALALTGYYGVDQWRCEFAASGAVLNHGRTHNVTPNGNNNRYTVNVTTIKASLAATDYFVWTHNIEGSRVADLGWGTAQAKNIIVRFWFRSSIAGTFSISVRNAAANRSYVKTFAVAANVDTPVSIAVPGDTTGTWAKDNTLGIVVFISLGAGTTYSAPTDGVWAAANYLGLTGQTNGLGTVASYDVMDFGVYADPNLTGVAPPWEMTDPSLDMTICQRYYQRVTIGLTSNVTNGSGYYAFGYAPIPMRAQATASGVNVSSSSFPSTVGTITLTSWPSFYEMRAATATINGWFATNISLNARM